MVEKTGLGDPVAVTPEEKVSIRKASHLSVAEFISRYIAYVALVVLLITFGILAPSLFLTLSNLETVLQNSAVLSLVAVGMTFVIIAGSIDLSVGSVMALSGAVAASFTVQMNAWAFLLAVAIGAFIGLINGVIFTKGRIPSFVVTLGMLSIARGATVIYTGGAPVPISFDSSFYIFGTPPVPFGLVIVFAVLSAFLLSYTTFGRYVYAIGGDEEKTRMHGVPVDRVKIAMFVISGAMAGIGGGVLTSQLGSGSPTSGIGFELMAISAVVIGGTPLTGGMGSILGTVVGSLVMTVLANGLIILGVSTNVQTILTGVVLIFAVLVSIQRAKIKIIK